MKRIMAASTLAGFITVGTPAAFAAGTIEITHQGGDTVDFGTVMSTALPGEIEPGELSFRVRVNLDEGGDYLYLVDYPEEITLETGGHGDFATVAVAGPEQVEGSTPPSGRDQTRFDITTQVTRIPDLGGAYSGLLPVTVTLMVEP